jgi:hypothetical protein
VEKNLGQKCVDTAKCLGLTPDTVNSIFAIKDKIQEQIEKCGNGSKKRKTGKDSTYSELESVLFS